MNKRFKKVISSVLAAVMTMGVVGVANVSSVFAETLVDKKAEDFSRTTSNTTVDVGGTSTSDVKNYLSSGTMYSDSNYTITAEDKFYLYSANSAISNYTTAFVSANGASNKVPNRGVFSVNLKAGDTIDVVYGGSDSSYNSPKAITVKLVDATDDDATALKENSVAASFTTATLSYTATADGKYKFVNTTNTNRTVLYEIKISNGGTTTYSTTLTGTITNSDITSFKLGGADASVENGTYSVTLDRQLTAGGTLTATCDGYYDATVTVSTVTESGSTDSAKNYVAAGSSITFEEKTYGNIAEGEYLPAAIVAGLPNFDIDALTIQNDTTDKYKGTLKFKLSGTANITVVGKCGSTSAGKYSTVSIGDTTFTNSVVVANEGDETGTATFTSYEFENVPAGEVSMVFDSNGSTFQVQKITVEYVVSSAPVVVTKATATTAAHVTYGGSDYAIVVVPKDKAGEGNTTKVTLTYGGEKKDGPDTVYESVQIGDTVIPVADLSSVADVYFYGYTVTSTDAAKDIGDMIVTVSDAE